jgi:hypothetical protein
MSRRALAVAWLAAGALAASSARAQDLEPRAYSNTPVGLNFAILGYAHSNGDVSIDASAPLASGKVETNGPVLAYARSLDVFGCSGKIDAILPFAWVKGSAEVTRDLATVGVVEGERVSRSVSGLGDARVRLSVNFYGAPALSLEDFPKYEQDLLIGASLQVTVPTGRYDDNRLLNVGANRWAFKPEIAISKNWKPFILELSAAGTFYTDNHDFFGGHDQAQNPIGSVQAHAIYSFPYHIWSAIDLTYYAGGKVILDGVANSSVLSNVRLGGTLALPVNKYNSIKLYGSSGVAARTGGNFDLIGIAWQVRWGAGF